MEQVPNQQLPPFQQQIKPATGLNPRIITIVSSVIILIIIITILIYWFFVIKPQVESQTETTPTTQNNNPQPTNNQSDDTSNWFLYVNTDGNYRLKYPPGFKKNSIKEEDLDPYTRQHQFESSKYEPTIIGEGFSSEGKGSAFFVDICEEDKSCIDSITKLNNKSATGQVSDEQDIEIDGIDAKRFVYKGLSGEQSVKIEFRKDDKTYTITLDHGKQKVDSEHLDLFNKMLTTFEFIN